MKLRMERTSKWPVAHFSVGEQVVRVPYEALGIDSKLPRLHYRDFEPDIPQEVLDLARDETWLEITPPAGDLDLIPWGPLLGLKRVVPGMAFATGREAVVIVASLARSKATYADYNGGRRMVEKLAARLTADGRVVHVFADAEMQIGPIDGVIVHAPPEEGPEAKQRAAVGRAARISNPWITWIASAMAGIPVSVLHFVCHGYHDGIRGALAFARSPSRNDDTKWARFVGAAELGALVERLAVEAVLITSPERDYSRVGLRRLLHDLTASHPISAGLQVQPWREAASGAMHAHEALAGTADGAPGLELWAPRGRLPSEESLPREGFELAQMGLEVGQLQTMGMRGGRTRQLEFVVQHRTRSSGLEQDAMRALLRGETRAPPPPAETPPHAPFGSIAQLAWSEEGE